MRHLENRNLMLLVVNNINDAILALTYAIANGVACKFFTAFCAGISTQRLDSFDDSLTVSFGAYGLNFFAGRGFD